MAVFQGGQSKWAHGRCGSAGARLGLRERGLDKGQWGGCPVVGTEAGREAVPASAAGRTSEDSQRARRKLGAQRTRGGRRLSPGAPSPPLRAPSRAVWEGCWDEGVHWGVSRGGGTLEWGPAGVRVQKEAGKKTGRCERREAQM